MIDEIFEMFMKEARARPGKDLVKNINIVFLELSHRIIVTQDNLKLFERTEKDHEK